MRDDGTHAGTGRQGALDVAALPDDAGDLLLPAARAAIVAAVGAAQGSWPRRRPPAPDEAAEPDDDDVDAPAWARALGASFVTLSQDGRLRGCVGSIEARRPLLVDVRENAVSAATRDPRFPPVTTDEVPGLILHVAVLTPPGPLDVDCFEEAYAALRPGVDGVVAVIAGRYRATFLPQVWDDLPDPEEFLRHLWIKAGFAPGVWYEGTRLETYTVRAWGEGGADEGRH